MRISDWSSDVCSSDLVGVDQQHVVIGLDREAQGKVDGGEGLALARVRRSDQHAVSARQDRTVSDAAEIADQLALHDAIFFGNAGHRGAGHDHAARREPFAVDTSLPRRDDRGRRLRDLLERSEAHTSELQSLMRRSYAVLCLKKKNYKE